MPELVIENIMINKNILHITGRFTKNFAKYYDLQGVCKIDFPQFYNKKSLKHLGKLPKII